MTSSYSTDIVIFGGGIAGLWLLNRLRNEGYHAILLEAESLGSGQTIASQGIIHGGLKYALSGSVSGAANAIAGMPARWRDCLQGKSDVNLSGCELLSEDYYMWSNAGFRSKIKTFLGSKSLRGRVDAVDKADYPEFFANATVAGSLYRLPDFVINTESLLGILRDQQQDYIFSIDAASSIFRRDSAGKISSMTVVSGGNALEIESQRTIFCAGEGNAQLIQQAALEKPRTQTRPLNMLYVRKPDLPSVFVHCIGDGFSLTPKLTLTSHKTDDGGVAWYLGGEIAESGVGRSPEQQVAAGKALLAQLFPWVDLGDAHWDCFDINRAEAKVDKNFRPDDALFIEEANSITAWPTKLTLSPSLADKLVEHFQECSLTKMPTQDRAEIKSFSKLSAISNAKWNS